MEKPSKEWAQKKITDLASSYRQELSDGALEMWARQVLLIVTTNDEVKHSKLGTVRPGDWLFDQALKTLEFFPKPIELRRIWTRYWAPADGEEADGA